jgi:serine/threonine-protein kinase
MEKDPARRFESVNAFAAALRSAAARETAEVAAAPPVTAPSRSLTTVRHLPEPRSEAATTIPPAAVTGSRRAVAGGIGTLVVLALGVAAIALTRPRETSPSPAPSAATQASPPAPPEPPPPPPPTSAPVPSESAAKQVPVKHPPPRREPAPRAEAAPPRPPEPGDETKTETPPTPAADTKRGSLIDRL